MRPVNPDRVTTVNHGVFILVSGMLLAQPRNWKTPTIGKIRSAKALLERVNIYMKRNGPRCTRRPISSWKVICADNF